MDESPFRILVTESAIRDLHEIDDFWSARREPDRAEQYVRNLLDVAHRELAFPIRARSGRIIRASLLPETREILIFKGSYRVIYRIDESLSAVHVLRFWHTHRDESEEESLG